MIMRKYLLSFFLILGGFASMAQLTAPKILTFPDKATKTGIFVILEAAGTGTQSVQLEVSGGGLSSPIVRLKPVGGIITFDISGLRPGTTYNLRARALGCPTATGCTTLSSWSAVKYTATKVDFPSRATLEVTGNCPQVVSLKWSLASTGGAVKNINIQKSFGGPWYDIANLPLGSTEHYDYDVRPGVHTTYRIYTYNENDENTESNHVSLQVRPYVAPGAPINLRSDGNHKTNSSIKVVWENPETDWQCRSNVRETYYIWMKRGFEADYTLLGTTFGGEATEYEITGLEQNEIVEVIVRARSDQGIWGEQGYLKDKTYGVASTPSNVIGVAYKDVLGNGVLGISWTHDEPDADYFDLEVSTDGETWTKLTTIMAHQKVVDHINISEGQNYTYRVKAGNYKYGESGYAYMDGYVSVPYSAAPNAPYGLSAVWTGGNVVLKWVDDSNKEAAYVIERAYKEEGPFAEVGEVGRSVTTYTNAIGTDTASNFYYRVYAENPIGASAKSKVVKVSKTTTAPAPVATVIAYPNPTVDKLNISIPSELNAKTVEVTVFNQLNQQVFGKSFNAGSAIDVNFKKFTPGIYNVVISTGDFKETKKIVKN